MCSVTLAGEAIGLTWQTYDPSGLGKKIPSIQLNLVMLQKNKKYKFSEVTAPQ